jgi:PhnB protein
MFWIDFDGNCREAMEFYAKILRVKVGGIKTYGETPPDYIVPFPESYKDKVAISDLQIGDSMIHFGDRPPSERPFIAGNNITLQLFIDSIEETTRVFNELKESGEVTLELQKTFYSELCGSIQDKFGVNWHIMGSSVKD